MGRRNLINKFPVWEDYDSSGTPSPSEPSTVDQVDIVKYVLTCDPTVSGVLQVEFTDDKYEKDEVWKPLDFGQSLTINGATDTEYTILIAENPAKKTRLAFTNGGGTGVINAWIAAANVGA